MDDVKNYPTTKCFDIEVYSNYGLPLGEAFQLRDDLISVFGDSSITGKPAGDDLREGKRTVLVATTLSKASTSQRELFLRNFGQPQLDLTQIESMREIIVQTGALANLEVLIEEMTLKARTAIKHGEITPQADSLLDEMAVAATSRNS